MYIGLTLQKIQNSLYNPINKFWLHVESYEVTTGSYESHSSDERIFGSPISYLAAVLPSFDKIGTLLWCMYVAQWSLFKSVLIIYLSMKAV